MSVETRFRLFRTLLLITGNPLFGDGRSIAYRIYAILAVTIAYGCYMGEVVITFMQLDDLKLIMENARVAIPVTAIIWIDLCIRFRKKSIEKMIILTEDFVWEDCPKINHLGHKSMAVLIPLMQKVIVHTLWSILIPNGIYMCIRGFTSTRLGVNSWFPFDTKPSPVHEIVVLIQVYSALLNCSNFMSFLGLYATFVAIACTQLEKLHYNLSQFRKTDVEVEDNISRDHLQYLQDCIQIHQSVLSFMRCMENTMGLVILGHFLVIIGALVFTVISFTTTTGEWGEVMQLCMLIQIFFSQLGIYCYFGSELTYYAGIIRDAAWECNWLDATIEEKRTLIFIMAAATKEFTLTAAGYISVSQRTMVKVLQQTLSFTMFLLNMKKRH